MATLLAHLRDAGFYAAAALGVALYFDLRGTLPRATDIADIITQLVQGRRDGNDRVVVVKGSVTVAGGGGLSSLLVRQERSETYTDPTGRSLLWFSSQGALPTGQRFWFVDDGTGRAYPARNSAPQKLSQTEFNKLLEGQHRSGGGGATALLDAVLGLAGASRFREDARMELLEGFLRVPRPVVGGERVTLVGRPIIPDGFTTLFIDGWAFIEHGAPSSKLLALDPLTVVLVAHAAVQSPVWLTAIGLASLSLASLFRAIREIWGRRERARAFE